MNIFNFFVRSVKNMRTHLWARTLLEEIEKIGARLPDRWSAAKNCYRWRQREGERGGMSVFALQAACEYLVNDEKERNDLIVRYNNLLQGVNRKLFRLKEAEPTNYSSRLVI